MSSVYDHPEWREFVKRVRETPADDTVRLVAADWLEERGEAARAELIRVQIAFTREPEFSHRAGDEVQTESGLWTFAWKDKPNPERARLRDRIAELTGVKPRPSGDAYVTASGVTSAMRAGFAEELRCPANEWCEHGDNLIAREPISQVTITGRSADAYQFSPPRIDPERPDEIGYVVAGQYVTILTEAAQRLESDRELALSIGEVELSEVED